MATPPTLTDRIALERNRKRALRSPALFLQETAIDEINDRLGMVNKTFSAPAFTAGFRDLWQRAFPTAACFEDRENLGLTDDAFDLIIHGLALHWSNDLVGQLIQCRRALRPDGLFLAVLFGGNTLSELRACLAEAEAEIRGGLSPRVAPMAEIRDLGALLQRAGFALPVADSLPLTVSYPSVANLMRDVRQMGETNALAARSRHFTRRAIFERAAEKYQKAHATKAGRITATFDLIFLTGWSPDASQPKPLRPGSASARLSEVLGTTETPLKD